MIPLDLNLLFKILRLHLKHKGLGVTTLCFLFILLPLFFLNNIYNQFFFLLDELLFFSYRKIKIDRPVFIVGPPRCGTSFFLDLVNKSYDMSSTKLWELYLAPSICQKLFWLQIGKIDRLLGSPLHKQCLRINDLVMGEFNKIHQTSLFHNEEDAMLFYHTGNSPFLIFVFPFKELMELFKEFDRSTSPESRMKFMKYYKKCIQKHLFVFGKDKTYVSKNPFFSTYIITLKEHFKDARFIYMTRTPYQVVPSAMNLCTWSKRFTRYIDYESAKDAILEMLKTQYTYPLENLDFKDQERNLLVQFQDLVNNPKGTVEKVLERFQISCTDELRRLLSEKIKNKQNYVSINRHSLKKYNIDESQFNKYFGKILSIFEYEG